MASFPRTRQASQGFTPLAFCCKSAPRARRRASLVQKTLGGGAEAGTLSLLCGRPPAWHRSHLSQAYLGLRGRGAHLCQCTGNAAGGTICSAEVGDTGSAPLFLWDLPLPCSLLCGFQVAWASPQAAFPGCSNNRPPFFPALGTACPFLRDTACTTQGQRPPSEGTT